jgi:mannose-6-phosphate isomerase-like protein (cupin superfamily)
MADIVKSGEGLTLGSPELRRNRFLLDHEQTARRIAVVEHTIGPHVLAGPLHLHTREDEYSLILEGRMGALLGGEEVYADEGDFVAKPRGEWHTFWNAAESTLRLLEIITPGGLEELFKAFGHADGYDPETLPALVAAYGCQVDFHGTAEVAQRLGLSF